MFICFSYLSVTACKHRVTDERVTLKYWEFVDMILCALMYFKWFKRSEIEYFSDLDIRRLLVFDFRFLMLPASIPRVSRDFST